MADTVQPDLHAPFNNIPDEQLESIISNATTRPDEGLQLALTCKRWYRVGIPLVFRMVVVHPNNIEAFLSRLQASLQSQDDESQEGPPGLGKYVKVRGISILLPVLIEFLLHIHRKSSV